MLLDPALSVTHFPFYRDVPRKSAGAVAGYLAYLGLFFSLASTISLYLHAGPLIARTTEWAATSMPSLTLSGGRLSSELAAPVLVRHPEVTQLSVMIDTSRTAAVSPAEMKEAGLSAYVTQNAVYLSMRNKLEAFDLSQARQPGALKIDAAFWRTMGATLARVLYPISLVTTWLLFLVWKAVSALFYSLLGLAMSAAASADLDYPSLYKLGVYAQTPAVALQMAALFLPRPVPFFGLIVVLVTAVYLWQGIRQQNAAAAA